MRKTMVLFVAAVLASTAGMAGDLAGAAYVKSGLSTEMPTVSHGENVLSQPDQSEVCCDFANDGGINCGQIGGPYNAGDLVTINTYWTEEITEPEVQYTVDWTAGLRLPNGNILILFDNEPVNFGDIADTGNYTFCTAILIEMPALCNGGSVVTHGHGVTTPNGSFPPAPSDPNSDDDTWTCN